MRGWGARGAAVHRCKGQVMESGVLESRFGKCFSAVLLGCALAGCQDVSVQEDEPVLGSAIPVVTDSGGVAIVTTAVTSSTPHWTLHPTPELEVGSADGEPAYLFAGIRYAARLSDGGVVVADETSGQLRFFDAMGHFVRSVGRRGPGPREFETFSGIVSAPGDTLVVYDLRNQRVTRVASNGEFVGESNIREMLNVQRETLVLPVERRDFAPLSPGDTPEQIGRYRSHLLAGPLMDGGHAFALQSVLPPPTSGDDTYRTNVHIVHVEPVSLRLQPIVRLPGARRMLLSFQGASREGGMVAVPFASEVLLAARHDLIVVSSTEHYELRVFDGTGELRHVIRRHDVVPGRIDAAHRAAYEDWEVNRPGAAREDLARQTAEAGFAVMDSAHLPTHSALVLDDADRIWVRDLAFPWEADRPATYTVFDRRGLILATATLLPRFRVLHIGAEHVTGQVVDDFGVEYVKVFRIAVSG
jgi:hypothetical protein